MKRRIELIRDPAARGGKIVLVDGEPWGKIEMRSHGPQGPSFVFIDSSGALVGRGGARQTVAFGVESQRSVERKAAPGEVVPPIETRLHAAAVHLINRGLLKSPTTIRAERERRALEIADYNRQEAERERQKFEAKADEIIKFANIAPALQAKVRELIVDAMKWAQMQ